MNEAPKPEGADQLGPVLEFMKQLWAVDHGLQSASKRMEASFGITGPQRLVVRIVGRFPGIAAGRGGGSPPPPPPPPAGGPQAAGGPPPPAPREDPPGAPPRRGRHPPPGPHPQP